MSRIKEPVDLYSIANVVEKNYEFCNSATRVFVCLFIYLFFTFLDSRNRLDRKGETARTLEDCLCQRFDGSSSVCVSDCFFPFLDFPCCFPRMTRYSKRNRGKQLATRNCSNIFSQRVSHRVFPQSINFWWS